MDRIHGNAKNVIITASDKKYGDFLIDHWLRSLKENVNLSETEVAVIDYGLTTSQKFYLEWNGVTIINGIRDGHVTSIRFRDVIPFLKKTSAEQVLMCDSGDIIFQDDISHVFSMAPDSFKAVCEEDFTLFTFVRDRKFFSPEDSLKFYSVLKEKPVINAGMVFGPKQKYIEMCEFLDLHTLDKSKFGPDQVVINWYLYEYGFTKLETKYNYVFATAFETATIIDGAFYLSSGEKIPVVHNCGNISFFRSIDNFGYGSECNNVKTELYNSIKILRTAARNINAPKKNVREFKKAVKTFFLNLQNIASSEEKKENESWNSFFTDLKDWLKK